MNAVESGAAAVSRLLQLIAPEPERLDEDAVLEAVQEAYNHDLPLMWAVYHLGKHEAVFAAEWADVFTLVEQLRAVAANWQADLLFGVQEAEDEALIFDCEPQHKSCAVMVSRYGVGRATIRSCVWALSVARRTRICCRHVRRRWPRGCGMWPRKIGRMMVLWIRREVADGQKKPPQCTGLKFQCPVHQFDDQRAHAK